MVDECYFVYKMENADGVEETFVSGYGSGVSADKFFRDVANKICFDDCMPVDVVKIVWHGKRVWYMGWMPGMVFKFADMYRNVVWEGCFPEWDH